MDLQIAQIAAMLNIITAKLDNLIQITKPSNQRLKRLTHREGMEESDIPPEVTPVGLVPIHLPLKPLSLIQRNSSTTWIKK